MADVLVLNENGFCFKTWPILVFQMFEQKNEMVFTFFDVFNRGMLVRKCLCEVILREVQYFKEVSRIPHTCFQC